ncbi:MAG: hypothetical protein Q8P26_01815 [Candidatus Levybacteria bacterium]|nr:hypothetical protein [Candidatus Levybacteria bacterium]
MEDSSEPLLPETKEQEYMRRAKEMIFHPDLPIAKAYVARDVEGRTSEIIVVKGQPELRRSGLLNGTIEDIARLAAVKVVHSESGHVPGKVDRHITLSVYDGEEGVRQVAEEIPRVDNAHFSALPWPAILEYVPPQPKLGLKVGFMSDNEDKDRIIKLLNPETKFEVMPYRYDPSSVTIAIEV